MQNHSQQPPASSKAPNEDLKDMDFLCTLEIQIESQNLDIGVSKTTDYIQIKTKMPSPSQEPPASKAPNQDFKDIDVFRTFKIKIENQNLDRGCIKDQWPYQDQDAKTQSGTTSILQSFKWGLKGNGSFWPFKTKIESQNWAHGCIKDKLPYPI